MAAQSPKCFIIRTENIKLHSWTLIILIIIIIFLQKSQIRLNIRIWISSWKVMKVVTPVWLIIPFYIMCFTVHIISEIVNSVVEINSCVLMTEGDDWLDRSPCGWLPPPSLPWGGRPWLQLAAGCSTVLKTCWTDNTCGRNTALLKRWAHKRYDGFENSARINVEHKAYCFCVITIEN